MQDSSKGYFFFFKYMNQVAGFLTLLQTIYMFIFHYGQTTISTEPVLHLNNDF